LEAFRNFPIKKDFLNILHILLHYFIRKINYANRFKRNRSNKGK